MTAIDKYKGEALSKLYESKKQEEKNLKEGKSSVVNIDVPDDLHEKLDKTVFILGAGASCYYGFPTGEKLLNDLKRFRERRASMNSIDSEFYQYMVNNYESSLEKNGISFENHLEYFIEELNNSGVHSIDTFLAESRNEINHHGYLGRILVSYLITRREDRGEILRAANDNNNYYNYNDDWISYFIHRLISYSRNKFLKILPKVLSFNYDNLFETKIKDNFEKTVGKTYCPIEVTHIHGQLDISNYEYNISNWDAVDKEAYYKQIVKSASQISMMRRGNIGARIECMTEIDNAEYLVFLGYSFDPLNNEILFGNRRNFDNCLKEKTIFTTTYGLHQKIIDILYRKDTIRPDIKCKDLIERLYPPPLFPEEI